MFLYGVSGYMEYSGLGVITWDTLVLALHMSYLERERERGKATEPVLIRSPIL